MADIGGISSSAGSQAAAALETAGYHTQSQILDIFASGFGSHAGGLLYLIGLIAAILVVSIGGSYRYGLWLLVGPSLFYYLTTVREPAQPAKWQMGERVHDEAKVLEGARGLWKGNAKVSVFFDRWNQLTSGIVQEMITLTKITEKAGDLDFLNKTDRYLSFWNSRVHDYHLKALLQLGLVNKCSWYFQAQRMLNDPHTPEERKPGIRKMVEDRKDSKIFNIHEFQELEEWVKKVTNQNEIAQMYSCDELWQLATTVVKEAQARGQVELLVKGLLPDGLKPEEAWERMRLKFGQRLQLGMAMESKEAVTEEIINEFTGRLITQEFNYTSRGLAQMELNEQPRIKSATRHSRDYDTDTMRAIRNKQATDEYLMRGELIGGALYMPYLQGMILYFLAVAFPFCALMVVVPGREGVMLLWMGLWLWAKLWDFGFAVVMLIDNMLYALLPHGPNINESVMNDPGKAWQALLESDPAYSAHSYYNLMACCLFAVPIICGFIVNRGGGELAHAVQQGVKDFTTNFGNSFAAFQRAQFVDNKMGEANKYVLDQLQQHAWSIILSDKEALKSMETSIAMGAGNKALGAIFKEMQNAKPGSSQANQLFKQLTSYVPMPKLMNTYLETAKQIHGEQAMSKLKYSLQRFAYDAYNSPYVRQLAVDSVLQKWNSHDFRRDFSSSAQAALEYLQASHAKYGSGKLYDEAFNSLIDLGVKGPQ